MESMIDYYSIVHISGSCECGETNLLSSMLQISLPCSHLRFCGIDFPHIDVPEIYLTNESNQELLFEYDILNSELIQADHDYFSSIRKFVSRIIKRYSYCQKKEQIIKYVEDKLPFVEYPKKFVLGYPSEIFHVIDEGIKHFKKT